MDSREINAFLTHLAVERRVAASTQNQALNALVFFYRRVLDIEFAEPRRPSRPEPAELNCQYGISHATCSDYFQQLKKSKRFLLYAQKPWHPLQ
jgi:hypothetical protein